MKKAIMIMVLRVAMLPVGLFAGCSFDSGYTGELTEGNKQLEAFSSIDVDALSPDVKVIAGNEYSVSYRLHGREHIDILEVKNGTLIFDTGYDFDFDVDFGNFNITITVPQNVILNDIDIKIVAGNIYTDIADIVNASLITTSGNIEVENSSVSTLNAKSTSKNIEVSGNIQHVDIHSTAGDCTVISKDLTGDIQTVSGNISVETEQTSIGASSFGKIRYNGSNMGYRYETSNSPHLSMDSVGGKITIK